MKPLDLSLDALWRKRFRASSIAWAVTAPWNQERGLVCTNKDGVSQLYAWDVPSMELRQVTYQPAGMTGGLLSADGNSIYYLKDEGGNEMGHYVCVPFSGGEAWDISPDLPPYSTWWITENRMGGVVGFMAAGRDGYKIYLKHADGAPELLYQSEGIIEGPNLSSDGRIAVIGSTQRTRTLDFSLLAIDTATGQSIRELCDENASITGVIFSPLAGQARVVAASNQSGFERPFIWDALTGERTPLRVDEIPGAIFPQRLVGGCRAHPTLPDLSGAGSALYVPPRHASGYETQSPLWNNESLDSIIPTKWRNLDYLARFGASFLFDRFRSRNWWPKTGGAASRRGPDRQNIPIDFADLGER